MLRLFYLFSIYNWDIYNTHINVVGALHVRRNALAPLF